MSATPTGKYVISAFLVTACLFLVVAPGPVHPLGFGPQGPTNAASDSTAVGQVSQTPRWLDHVIPQVLKSGEFLDLSYWQWIGLLLLIFLGIVVDQAVRFLLRPLLRRTVLRLSSETEEARIRDV